MQSLTSVVASLPVIFLKKSFLQMKHKLEDSVLDFYSRQFSTVRRLQWLVKTLEIPLLEI